MLKRVVYGIILIVGAFVLPWWLSSILVIVGLFYFKRLYEVIFVGIIIDSLSGSSYDIYGFEFVFTLFFIIAYLIITRVRKNILV